MTHLFVTWWPYAAAVLTAGFMLAAGAGRWWGWAGSAVCTGLLWGVWALESGNRGTLYASTTLGVVYLANALLARYRPMRLRRRRTDRETPR